MKGVRYNSRSPGPHAVSWTDQGSQPGEAGFVQLVLDALPPSPEIPLLSHDWTQPQGSASAGRGPPLNYLVSVAGHNMGTCHPYEHGTKRVLQPKLPLSVLLVM